LYPSPSRSHARRGERRGTLRSARPRGRYRHRRSRVHRDWPLPACRPRAGTRGEWVRGRAGANAWQLIRGAHGTPTAQPHVRGRQRDAGRPGADQQLPGGRRGLARRCMRAHRLHGAAQAHEVPALHRPRPHRGGDHAQRSLDRRPCGVPARLFHCWPRCRWCATQRDQHRQHALQRRRGPSARGRVRLHVGGTEWAPAGVSGLQRVARAECRLPQLDGRPHHLAPRGRDRRAARRAAAVQGARRHRGPRHTHMPCTCRARATHTKCTCHAMRVPCTCHTRARRSSSRTCAAL
jgi:hypothetical protein